MFSILQRKRERAEKKGDKKKLIKNGKKITVYSE